eukprot:GEMP01008777.1.p1 GENE.GEMP01008777.1~~GEMP01008777.1.p1  ORF type:complete len:333 (+),score=80.47 GEMP01008777.1:124-1122(+)
MPSIDQFHTLDDRDQDLLVRKQINLAIGSDANISKAFDHAIRRYEVVLNYVGDAKEALPKVLVETAGVYFKRMRFLKDLQQQLTTLSIPELVDMTPAEVAEAMAVSGRERAISVNNKYEISKKIAVGGAQVTKQVGGMASWMKKIVTGENKSESHERSTGTRTIVLDEESPLGRSHAPSSADFSPAAPQKPPPPPPPSFPSASPEAGQASSWASAPETDVTVVPWASTQDCTPLMPVTNSDPFESLFLSEMAPPPETLSARSTMLPPVTSTIVLPSTTTEAHAEAQATGAAISSRILPPVTGSGHAHDGISPFTIDLEEDMNGGDGKALLDM